VVVPAGGETGEPHFLAEVWNTAVAVIQFIDFSKGSNLVVLQAFCCNPLANQVI
jgi:hypothetical protein